MRRSSVLIINRVAPPARGATGRYLADLAGGFVEAGWHVRTLTADGCGRAAAFGRLALSAFRLPRHELVVTMTDPPFLPLLGPPLAALWGARLLHWCQDLYPPLFPVLGHPLPAGLTGPAGAAMSSALRRHDAVVAIGRCMAGRLAGLGVPTGRISVVPNWAPASVRPDPEGSRRLRAGLGLEGRFVVSYSGTFGLAHPMEDVLEAISLLAGEAPGIAWLLSGQGARFAALRQALDARPYPTVRLLPWQLEERLPALLGAADLHLAVMAQDAEGLLVPCKVPAALAAGRPCLLIGPAGGEAARLLVETGAGTVVAPGNPRAMAEAVLSFARDPARLARASASARAWAASYGRVEGVGRLLALAEGLVCAGERDRTGGAGWPRA
jgi:colanic acid biosynthesis glycosyl transferase WcaI